MVAKATILSNDTAEQSFIDAAKDWLNGNKDAVLGVAGAYTGAEFENLLTPQNKGEMHD